MQNIGKDDRQETDLVFREEEKDTPDNLASEKRSTIDAISKLITKIIDGFRNKKNGCNLF